MNWISWPTEPGYYWFYGWEFGSLNMNPKYHIVRAVGTPVGAGRIAVTGDGHFWRHLDVIGLFARTEPPPPPSLSSLMSQETENLPKDFSHEP